eukprot:91519-Pleurochrysis_carterae.AAC.2
MPTASDECPCQSAKPKARQAHDKKAYKSLRHMPHCHEIHLLMESRALEACASQLGRARAAGRCA